MNKEGAEVGAGLLHFERTTGLKVHSKLLGIELSAARVINANLRNAPHLKVEQHGVIVRTIGDGSASRAFGGPRTPGAIEYVGLLSSMPPTPTTSASVSYSTATIAHVLLHTVNVYHHGSGDQRVVRRLDQNGDLVEESGGGAGATQKIIVHGEKHPSVDRTPDIVWWISHSGIGGRLPRYLGIGAGLHSGTEDCLMRYDVANTYKDDHQANVRYTRYQAEVTGTKLCSSAKGTGVNEAGRGPQSRFHDAGVGDCRHQILVNDGVKAPTR